MWETKIEQQKALRKFAHQMGRPWQSVSIEEVEATTLGVKGWAEAAVIVPLKGNAKSGPGDDELGKQSLPARSRNLTRRCPP